MPIASDVVLSAFLLFCRIGSCLMLMPGFSSPRVPVQIRLFIAIGITLALAPLLLPNVMDAVSSIRPALLLLPIAAEIVTGIFIGLLGRIFFLALQFMATAVANFVGYAGFPETAIEDAEPSPPLASLITLTATVLFFIADLHWEVLRGLVRSYAVIPVNELIASNLGLSRIVDATSDAFILSLQISSPFIVYAFAIHMAFGIVNKLTPQIPVYFISLPFVIFGGLVLMTFVIGEFLLLFLDGVSGWLMRG